jgi:curved DNA-binding protein CbpA
MADVGPEWDGAAFLERAEGPPEKVPPIRLLFLAHRVDATGVLLVERPGELARIVLKAGRVVHVEGVPGLLASLDPRLPDPQNLPQNVAAAVAAGHAVDRVLDAAALGLGEWLARTARRRGGRVRFDVRATGPAGAFPLPLSVPRLIASGLRMGRPANEVERQWASMGAARAVARVPEDSPESRWGLDPLALRVLRLAQSTVDVNHLLREASGGESSRRPEALRALDLLYLLGMIVVDGGPHEREPTVSRTVSLPSPAPTDEDGRAARLRDALSAMEGAHPVDILELGDRKVLAENEVQQAYRDISRRYHPDTYFSAPPLVRAMAEACFSKINAAYEALRAPGGLADAQRLLTARATGRGFVTERDHQAARVAFRKAEVLFRNRDWKGADPLYAEAARLDATTWPHAFYAIRAGALSRRLTADEAVKQLDALTPPDMARRAEVLVAIGNIYKLDGRAGEALRRYKSASEADPENRDAQRELRLHQSRTEPARTGPSAPPATSVLSGLFRRPPDKG